MTNLLLGLLPVFDKVMIVPQDHLLDVIGCHQGLLLVLLSVRLNPSDLGTVGPPLSFSIVHIEEWISGVIKTPYIHSLPCVLTS